MQQIGAKRVQKYIWVGGEGDLLGIGQKKENSLHYQMINAQIEIQTGKWDT